MAVWLASIDTESDPSRVLGVLTDPAACGSWSPIPFTVEGLANGRIRSGSRARLEGELAGRSVAFEVLFVEVSDSRLELRARGPLTIEATYDVAGHGEALRIQARLSVSSSGGLTGRVLEAAADGLLRMGLLDRTVRSIAVAAGTASPCAELARAA